MTEAVPDRARQRQELRVATRTDRERLAYAIFRYVQEGSDVTLYAVGDSAVAVAVMAVVKANAFLSEHQKRVKILPIFRERPDDWDATATVRETGLRLYVEEVV